MYNKTKNEIIFLNDYAKIITKKGEEIIVDLEDIEKLSKVGWSIISGSPYTFIPAGDKKYKRVLLKNYLFDKLDSKPIYHLNKNKLDNRKSNLSFVKNTYEAKDNYAIMTFDGREETALIDKNKVTEVSKYSWNISSNGYVVRQEKIDGRTDIILLHRFLMNPNKKEHIDHINHNTLDNRLENLRTCTISENMRNKPKYKEDSTSQYKGASWCERDSHWVSVIIIDNKKAVRLGTFKTELAAAHCYNFFAKIYHGEFANINEDLPPLDWYNYRQCNKRISQYRGVSYDRRVNKWVTEIYHNGKANYIKKYENEIDAALRYNEEAIKLGIPLHKLNIINEDHLQDIKKLGESGYRGKYKNR